MYVIVYKSTIYVIIICYKKDKFVLIFVKYKKSTVKWHFIKKNIQVRKVYYGITLGIVSVATNSTM